MFRHCQNPAVYVCIIISQDQSHYHYFHHYSDHQIHPRPSPSSSAGLSSYVKSGIVVYFAFSSTHMMLSNQETHINVI